MSPSRHFLFLVTSTREPGHLGNTEWLARQATASLPAGTQQTWHHLARMDLPPFVDQRHTAGQYAMPEGDMKTLLDATLVATDIVFVAPVYWYSIPAPLKTYIDHWSAWLRVPGLNFKDAMAHKTLRLITTSGDRVKAQPMIDSVELCAQFLAMTWVANSGARAARPRRCSPMPMRGRGRRTSSLARREAGRRVAFRHNNPGKPSGPTRLGSRIAAGSGEQ